MLGATRIPLFSVLSSQTVNNTRVGNKADMGLIWRLINIEHVEIAKSKSRSHTN